MNQKSFNSFKDFAENYYEEHPEIQVQKLLHSYGIDIPIEEINDIDILEKDKRSVKYLNKKTNEIVTSDLITLLPEKYGKTNLVRLTVSNTEENFIIDQFNLIQPAETYEQAGKNTLEARKSIDTRLLLRAYADIKTDYGTICLHIEEGYDECKVGFYRQVSLYAGAHNEIMAKYNNDFDVRKYCIFRSKFINNAHFNQWYIGPMVGGYPSKSIWKYDEVNLEDEKVSSSIYAEDSFATIDDGIIILNGKIKLNNNKQYLPERYGTDRLEELFKEYENKEYTSKAYFSNPREFVAILKSDNKITIEYTKYEFEKGAWKKRLPLNISSKTDKEFTSDDFKNIIANIGNLDISIDLKKVIVEQLIAYINTHFEDDFEKLSVTLENVTFEEMLEYMKNNNLRLLVENLLESISSTFSSSKEELLGKVSNQTKDIQYVKKPKKE